MATNLKRVGGITLAALAGLLLATSVQAQTSVQVAPGIGEPVLPPPVNNTWRLGIYATPLGGGGGLHIDQVLAYSAAERMGLEQYDVIVQINGRPIRNLYGLRAALAVSGVYVRVMVLDHRTNTYQWVRGGL
jgi:hypothetical protein